MVCWGKDDSINEVPPEAAYLKQLPANAAVNLYSPTVMFPRLNLYYHRTQMHDLFLMPGILVM